MLFFRRAVPNRTESLRHATLFDKTTSQDNTVHWEHPIYQMVDQVEEQPRVLERTMLKPQVYQTGVPFGQTLGKCGGLWGQVGYRNPVYL